VLRVVLRQRGEPVRTEAVEQRRVIDAQQQFVEADIAEEGDLRVFPDPARQGQGALRLAERLAQRGEAHRHAPHAGGDLPIRRALSQGLVQQADDLLEALRLVRLVEREEYHRPVSIETYRSLDAALAQFGADQLDHALWRERAVGRAFAGCPMEDGDGVPQLRLEVPLPGAQGQQGVVAGRAAQPLGDPIA